MNRRADLRLAILLCGAIGLYDLIHVLTTVSGTAVVGYKFDILFPDFLVFHAAARAFFLGKLDVVYDTSAFTHLLNTLYADRLPYELGFRPFLYPPIWLLGLLPFGLPPFAPAVALFLLLTATACIIALRTQGLPALAIAAIMISPATVWVVFGGQNTLLSVALLYGGFALLERRPLVAGLLLGLLAYKPQIWILVPLALLAARAWRPLIAMAITVAVLSLASLALFGLDFWLAFLAAARHAGSPAFATEMFARVGPHIITLVAAGKALGLPGELAMALQVAGSLLAIAAVTYAFARFPPGSARLALLVTATFLVSPYTLNYDLLLLMPAVVSLFLVPPSQGYMAGERVLYLALWLIPTACLELNDAGIPLTPLFILWFGFVAWNRLQAAAKVELPSVATAR